MPKSQFIDPEVTRKKGKITFTDIPVNQYDKNDRRRKKEFFEQ